jgi:bifunctional N-acetylglucosamine-1-phosphate-uridyltransferase/glucosamine-1-phosphate-acetyltransferase GlmU-like protein
MPILLSKIALLARDCALGPFARIRGGTELSEGAELGQLCGSQ